MWIILKELLIGEWNIKMKDTTKLLIMLITFIILSIIFFTISALVPALKMVYIILGIVDTIIYFIIFVIWISTIFGRMI